MGRERRCALYQGEPRGMGETVHGNHVLTQAVAPYFKSALTALAGSIVEPSCVVGCTNPSTSAKGHSTTVNVYPGTLRLTASLVRIVVSHPWRLVPRSLLGHHQSVSGLQALAAPLAATVKATSNFISPPKIVGQRHRDLLDGPA